MTYATEPLAGLFVPLITPFTDDGELDPDALERLAHQMLDNGATGIVALGTTAEAPTLTEAERSRVLDICAMVCRDRSAPLIAGAGGNDTRRSAEALRALSAWPEIGAALVVVPYYSRPGEDGTVAHFRALAADTPVPLVVYNIPHRTGQRLSWRAMRGIAELPAVAGVKHAVGAIDQDTVEMMASLPDGVQRPGRRLRTGSRAARARGDRSDQRLGACLHAQLCRADHGLASRRRGNRAATRAPAGDTIGAPVRRAEPGCHQGRTA